MSDFGKFWLGYLLVLFVGIMLITKARAEELQMEFLYGLMCTDSDAMVSVMETYRDKGYDAEDALASRFEAEGTCVRIPEAQPIGLYVVLESVVVGKRRLYGLARDPYSPPVFWAQMGYTSNSL